ncbi:hypothetical protein I4U23_029065 [Adineta vaga]|nr:hypothetical protein I4U23_029065 [Adineta vaga]
MSSNTFLLLLVILHLFSSIYAYRINPNNEPTDILFRSYEGPAINEERFADSYDVKHAETNDLDNYYIIPCHMKSSHVLCNKLDRLSRRDTGFLRFGRKR